MKSAVLALVLFASPALALERPSDAEITKAIENLNRMSELSLQLETQHANGKTLRVDGEPVDPWGTPYRIEIHGGTFWIISAGADRKFDPESWKVHATIYSLDADVIATKYGFLRSNFGYVESLLASDPNRKPRLASLKRAQKKLMQLYFREMGDVPFAVPPAEPSEPPVERRTALRVGGDVKAPVAIHRVDPQYTPEARAQRLGGVVIIEAVISENGDIVEAKVLKGLTPDLDKSTLDAVNQWKFQPGTLDGKPVPVIYNLTVSFRPE